MSTQGPYTSVVIVNHGCEGEYNWYVSPEFPSKKSALVNASAHYPMHLGTILIRVYDANGIEA